MNNGIRSKIRQKGHYYLTGADYEDSYNRIWGKVSKSDMALFSTWSQRVTNGLHAVMPIVLDIYWTFMVSKGRIAAPLTL